MFVYHGNTHTTHDQVILQPVLFQVGAPVQPLGPSNVHLCVLELQITHGLGHVNHLLHELLALIRTRPCLTHMITRCSKYYLVKCFKMQ